MQGQVQNYLDQDDQNKMTNEEIVECAPANALA